MRKIFALAIALIATTCFAQTSKPGTFSITPRGGVDMSTFHQTIAYTSMIKIESRNLLGVTGGIDFGYQLSKHLGVTVGAAYGNMGSRFYLKGWGNGFDGKLCQLSNDYLQIPLVANFYVADGLALKAGIQPAFLLGAKEAEEKVEMKDLLNHFDMQIPIGISYEYGNLILDVRYIFGLANVMKEKYTFVVDETPIEANNKFHNRTLSVTIGYKIKL